MKAETNRISYILPVYCWVNKMVNKYHFQFSEKDYTEMQSFANFIGYVKGLDLTRCDRHLRSQSDLIKLNQVVLIGRLENINDDKMVEEVFDLHEQDIRVFNYSFSLSVKLL